MFVEWSRCLLTAAQGSASDVAACFGCVVVSHTGFAAPDLGCLGGSKIDVVGWLEFPYRLGSAAALVACVASFAAVDDVAADDVAVAEVVDAVDDVAVAGVGDVAGVAGVVAAGVEESCPRHSLETHPWNWPSCSSG